MNNELYHHGIKGQKWGDRNGPPYPLDAKDHSAREKKESWRSSLHKTSSHIKTHARKAYDSAKETTIQKAYAVGAKANPREFKYAVRKALNNPNETSKLLSDFVGQYVDKYGVLPTSEKALKAVETIGITKHQSAVYGNISDEDIGRFKKYTDAARYSRNVNSYLAIGEPKHYAQNAAMLKESLAKNKVSDVTVYRSCNLNFSTTGLAKKMSDMGDAEWAMLNCQRCLTV